MKVKKVAGNQILSTRACLEVVQSRIFVQNSKIQEANPSQSSQSVHAECEAVEPFQCEVQDKTTVYECQVGDVCLHVKIKK